MEAAGDSARPNPQMPVPSVTAPKALAAMYKKLRRVCGSLCSDSILFQPAIAVQFFSKSV
jgi:hypothetical protein